MNDYSASGEDRAQNLALGFKESLGATNAPISEIVASIIPDYRAMFEEAAAKKKRAKDRHRQQRHRARPRETTAAKLASILRKTTAKPRGPFAKQLEQLRGRELELAGFRYLSRIIIARYGPMSDADLARHLGLPNRKKAWDLRKIVADLEAEGGPWHQV